MLLQWQLIGQVAHAAVVALGQPGVELRQRRAFQPIDTALRADLTTMPEMEPAELQAMMPGHNRRAMRLMEMHREMMAGMHD